MSHKNPLRKDKTCLNCNHVVDQRFCPNCGQENTDTRKTFHHLFVHFFEDLTHYENAFWKTIKNLLLRPASLTKEYLSGKRLSYLAPVRLYIFISFVTFFMMAVLPDEKDEDDAIEISEKKETAVKSSKNEHFNFADTLKKRREEVQRMKDSIAKRNLSKEALRIEQLKKTGILNDAEADSIKKLIEIAKKKDKDSIDDEGYLFSSQYKTVAELDSVRKAKPEEMNFMEYFLEKRSIELKKKYTGEQLKERFMESIKKNIPKALFFYLPIFALVLWLFHNKKRWYYFDHGIFTLHYFSFLLLIQLILLLISQFLNLFGDALWIEVVDGIIQFVGFIWMFYYFFPAHHRFYGETRWVSFFKSVFIFFINSILFTIGLVLFFVITFINLH